MGEVIELFDDVRTGQLVKTMTFVVQGVAVVSEGEHKGHVTLLQNQASGEPFGWRMTRDNARAVRDALCGLLGMPGELDAEEVG